MKVPALWLFSAVLLPLVAHAKCLPAPLGMTEIEITSCQAVRFAASPSMDAPAGAESSLHAPEASYTATVIAGPISPWSWVWSSAPPHPDVLPVDWLPAKHGVFVVDDSANAVCPRSLPAKRVVVTTNLCCDEVPRSGACLAPLVQVTVEGPASRPLFPHQPASPGPGK